jgi:hypothetical protein
MSAKVIEAITKREAARAAAKKPKAAPKPKAAEVSTDKPADGGSE